MLLWCKILLKNIDVAVFHQELTLFLFWIQVDSVRFGIIGSFVAKRDIKKGEEIYSNYGLFYAPMTEIIPEYPSSSWYFENWQKYKVNHPNEKEYIENAERINKSIKP